MKGLNPRKMPADSKPKAATRGTRRRGWLKGLQCNSSWRGWSAGSGSGASAARRPARPLPSPPTTHQCITRGISWTTHTLANRCFCSLEQLSLFSSPHLWGAYTRIKYCGSPVGHSSQSQPTLIASTMRKREDR